MKHKTLVMMLLAPLCACSTKGILGKINEQETKMPNNPRISEYLNQSEKGNLNLPEAVYENLRSSQTTLSKERAPKVSRKFDINAEDVDAKLFFLNLAKDTPYNIVLHDDISGKISLELNAVTLLEVLETVKNVYGYDYKKTNNTIEIFPAILQTRSFVVNYLDLNRNSFSTTRVSAGGSTTGSTSTASTSNSDGSSGTSSSSNSSSSGQSSDSTLSSQINTTSNSNFWTELKQTIEAMIGTSGGRKVAVSPLAGLLVVQAMPSELNRVADFLASAEFSLNRQVILEAKIMEVQLGENSRTGIDWVNINGRLRLSQLGGDMFSDNTNISSVGNSFPAIANPTGTTTPPASALNLNPGIKSLPTPGTLSNAFGGLFTMAFNYNDLAAFIELLSTQGKVQVLSSPRVSTLNHQKALIKVGADDYFVTNVSSTTVSTGSTSSSTPNVTFQPFFSGISLDVIPHISEDNHVTLHIHPAISNVTNKNITIDLGTLGTQQYPLASSSIRESDSIVRSKNGQVIVIGGLMQDQHLREEGGIPVLKNLPGIGKIFKQSRSKKQKSELVILLRAIVVDNDSCAWNKALKAEANRFEDLE
ncbi:MAG: type pilus secretin MshL [Pseudomonadota bacterium]|jgi:MSHA biogenesis protein MshL